MTQVRQQNRGQQADYAKADRMSQQGPTRDLLEDVAERERDADQDHALIKWQTLERGNDLRRAEEENRREQDKGSETPRLPGPSLARTVRGSRFGRSEG